MNSTVSPKLLEIFKSVVKKDIGNFDIIVHDGNKKGEGFLGEMIFVTLEDKTSSQIHNFAVKQAFRKEILREMNPIRSFYTNEIYFYTQVWPTFKKFQQRVPPQCQFQKTAKCYATVSEELSEMLVLENLKCQGFEMYDKRKPLDREHFELILKEYGKFHALSFAFKALHPQNYNQLAGGTSNIFLDLGTRDFFVKGNVSAHENCLKGLLPDKDDAVIEKYKCYPEICHKLFLESIQCETKYAVILHGDCWSNNMMFKYDESKKVADVRFLDFQLSTEGSPCCDLSYCIYSGASKEILDDLDYYLQVYHDSLSETLKHFGCDSSELYPFYELKNDWKRYCKLGFIMALFIWRIKTTYEGEVKDLEDLAELSEDELKASRYDEENYKIITRDLILHLYENNFL